MTILIHRVVGVARVCLCTYKLGLFSLITLEKTVTLWVLQKMIYYVIPDLSIFFKAPAKIFFRELALQNSPQLTHILPHPSHSQISVYQGRLCCALQK